MIWRVLVISHAKIDAVEAASNLYCLTYKGTIDMEIMEVDLQKAAIEHQADNFDQTPTNTLIIWIWHKASSCGW